MPENIPFGDLIVIAAIAIFILLRYRNILGQKTGHDFSQKRNMTGSAADNERVIQLPDRKTPVQKKDDDIELASFSDNDRLAETLGKMKAIDPQFSFQEFLEGAKAAFDMVIEAFNKRDRDTLKMLLSKEVFESFRQVIEEREEADEYVENVLVAVESAEISDAELKRSTARVTVKFVSEQMQVKKDKDGNTLPDQASATQTIEDDWVFERDMKSRNPNWTIVET